MNQNKIIKILLITYLFILTWIIVFKLSFNPQELSTIRSINLIPFHYDNEVSFHLTEVIENILIFIPLGILLKMSNHSIKNSILYGLILSIIYESLQYIFAIGATDITDIITNTIGSFIGALSYYILLKVFKNQSKINNILIIIGLIFFIVFFILFILLTLANI